MDKNKEMQRKGLLGSFDSAENLAEEICDKIETGKQVSDLELWLCASSCYGSMLASFSNKDAGAMVEAMSVLAKILGQGLEGYGISLADMMSEDECSDQEEVKDDGTGRKDAEKHVPA